MLRRILAFVIVAPIALFGVYRCSYLPMRCSTDVAQSERELVGAANQLDPYAGIVAGRAALQRLGDCHIRPLDVDPALLTALAYRLLQQHEASIDWYTRALSIDRRPEIYFGLGVEQLKAKKREDGLRSLVLACAFAPQMIDSIDDGIVRDEVVHRIRAEFGPTWLSGQ